MIGARQEHVVVALAIFARFREHLHGTRCRPCVSDMKLGIDAADAVFHPDVMVSCDEDDRRAILALQRESTAAQPWIELGSIGLKLTLDEAFGDLDEVPPVPQAEG